MKRRLLLAPLIIFLVAADGPLRTAADRPIDIRHIRLDINVSLKEKKVAGTATIDYELLRELQTFELDAVDHVVSSIKLLNPERELEYANTGKKLTIDLGAAHPRGHQGRVVITYEVEDPKSGLYFFRPTKAEPEVPWMVWSQGESISNRYWFPSVDNPNEMQTTEIVATVDKQFECLSNGRLVSRKPIGGDLVTFHWQQSKPHVSYLVTLVVGEFVVTREEWRGIPVTYYVPPPRAADTQRTFGRTVEMLDFFSAKFGIDYPWDQYAQVVVEQFIAGGMENTTASTLYGGTMHDKRAFLDSTPDWLIAHELGHQWWGDLVTCKDWAHLWLNEGFATYCEVMWAEHKDGKDERDYLLVGKSRRGRSSVTTRRPIMDRHYPSPGSMFDDRAYPKAGWVLHMLRSQLGDDTFYNCLTRYGVEMKHKPVETADFRRVLEQATGRSLERFFYDWIERPGFPNLQVSSSYLAKDKLAKITIKQAQEGEAFHFPLRIEIVVPKQEPVVVNRQITEKDLSFYVPVKAKPSAIRVDPGLTLLAKISENKSREWHVAQLSAPTVAERVRAVEHFGNSKTPADRKLLIKTLNEDKFYGVQLEAAKSLGKSGGDISRDALIAGLTGGEHPKVRRACAEALAKFQRDEIVIDALAKKLVDGDDSYFVESEAIKSFGKVQDDPSLKTLQAKLKLASHNEVIRRAAIESLVASSDSKARKLLTEWTERGHPRRCRTTAMATLAKHLNRHPATDHELATAVKLLTGYLTNEGPRVRRSAVLALQELGKAAQPAVEQLQSLADQDADGWVRDTATVAVEKIRGAGDPKLSLQQLQKQVDALRRARESLEDRLDRIERK